MLRRLAVTYFGGAVAAVVSSVLLCLAARAELLSLVDVRINPPLTMDWLEPRIVWGGIFGLAYTVVGRMGYGPTRGGLLMSLLPSAAQLGYSLPQAGYGMLGLELGTFTPAVIILVNAVWGLVLARTVSATGERFRTS